MIESRVIDCVHYRLAEEVDKAKRVFLRDGIARVVSRLTNGSRGLQLHLAIASRTPSTIAPSTIVPSTTPISMASNELRTPSTMGFLCYFLSPITGLGFYKICLTKEVLDFSSSSNYKHLAI